MPLSRLRRAQLLSGTFTDLLAQHKAAVAAFYETLSLLLPAAKKFWKQLASEEREHEAMVKELDELFKKGELRFQRPRVAPSSITDSIGFVSQRRYRAAHYGITMREALKEAMRLESNMIELNFFDIIADIEPAAHEVRTVLAKQTQDHFRRVKRESNKLRWMLFGHFRSQPINIPDGVRKAQTLDESRLMITSAQGTILALAMDMEDAAADLYRVYSLRLKESSDFWARMVAEEHQHAAMLGTLEEMLEHGVLFHNIGRFDPEELQNDIDHVLDLATKAKTDYLTPYDACMTALSVEKKVVESKFYQIVDADAPEYKHIAKRLIELSVKHIARLTDETQNVSAMGAAAHRAAPKL